jgi:hypothetical protein
MATVFQKGWAMNIEYTDEPHPLLEIMGFYLFD